jgi:tRNA A-37 threonylcarbamoyl transferase component Bud32
MKRINTVIKKTVSKLKHFASMRHGSNPQFIVTVDRHELACDEIIRLLPGRRLVASSLWGEQQVIAKLFMSGRAKAHMERELIGYEALRKSGLKVPEVVYAGKTDVGGLYVVIYEKINLKASVDDIWKGGDTDALFSFLEQAHEVLAKQHEHNVYQADLHPHNFLIGDQGVYSIDYSTLVVDARLSQQKEIDILAGFYTQLHIKHHHLIENAFKHYAKLRAWEVNDKLFNQLKSAEFSQRHKRIKRLKKRLLRNSSAVKYKRGFLDAHAVMRGMYQHYVTDFFEMPYEYLRSTISTPMKLGNSTSVFRINFPGHHLMIKRYNVKSAWQWLRRCWRRSRAKKAWIIGNVLHMLGLPAQEPVAFFEYHIFGLNGRGYYIARYVDGQPLKNYTAQKLSEKDLADIVEQVFSIFYQLHTAKICHGDCKATNFIVKPDGKVVLVDIDGTQIYKKARAFNKQFQKEIHRFLRNWKDESLFKQQIAEKLNQLLSK